MKKGIKKEVFKVTTSEIKIMNVIKLDLDEHQNVLNSDTQFDVTFKTPKEIDEILNDLIKTEDSAKEPEWLSFLYYINVWEVMIDNREIFGHTNQKSEKFLRHETGQIYFRGIVKKLGEFMNSIPKSGLTVEERNGFYEYLKDCGYDKNSLTKKELETNLIMISRRKFPIRVLFEEFQDGFILRT